MIQQIARFWLVLLVWSSAQWALAEGPSGAQCDDDRVFTEISKTELKTLIEKKGVTVVDVRLFFEFGLFRFGSSDCFF